MLHSKTTTNDFNFPVAFRPFPHKGLADEYRANGFFSNHGPAASLGFPQMRQTVSWRPQNTAIHLHGPVSKYGICSINVPREFARHRSMPARQPVKTLSYGHSIPHLTKHISRRQRKSRLANLIVGLNINVSLQLFKIEHRQGKKIHIRPDSIGANFCQKI